jgi:hypothetical protein
MVIETGYERSENGVPYTWLLATIDCGLEVSIRKYPRRTFLAYSDDRANCSSGEVGDCYLAPTYIFSKMPNGEFSIKEDLPPLLAVLEIALSDDEIDLIQQQWKML